ITLSVDALTAKYFGLEGRAVPPVVAISSRRLAYSALPGRPRTYVLTCAVFSAEISPRVAVSSLQFSGSPNGGSQQFVGPRLEQPGAFWTLSWQRSNPQVACALQFGAPSVARIT